jgi:hypothetical protein
MSLDDPRVQFYLRHREQFSEWFDLRADAAAAVDEWLAELQPTLEALAVELGDSTHCQIETGENEGWPGMFLAKPSWAADGRGAPRIGLQWTRRKTLLVGSSTPWVGVHASRSRPGGRALVDSPAFQAIRRSRKDAATVWWGAYRSVLPERPFPAEAESYSTLLVEAVRLAWLAYAACIDEALAGPRAPGPAEAAPSQ